MIKWLYKPSGNCPVQSEGTFLNHYFYFRARYSTATIEFTPTEQNWENNNVVRFTLCKTSDPYKAGWLSKWKCLLLIYWGCFLLKYNIMKHKKFYFLLLFSIISIITFIIFSIGFGIILHDVLIK